MGTQKVLIFGSMPCPGWDFLRPYKHWADLVIAADGGVQCALDAGFTPDIYVGDSDSGGHALTGMECIPLPAEKDLTDLQAAYETALNRGAGEIIFTGCTGGRQDHHLSALGLLETAAGHGVHGMILDPWNSIEFLAPGEYSVPKDGYTYFSLIPIDRVMHEITIRGAKYPLECRDTFRGDSLTVSNEWNTDPVELRFTDGCCYLIRSNNPR